MADGRKLPVRRLARGCPSMHLLWPAQQFPGFQSHQHGCPQNHIFTESQNHRHWHAFPAPQTKTPHPASHFRRPKSGSKNPPCPHSPPQTLSSQKNWEEASLVSNSERAMAVVPYALKGSTGSSLNLRQSEQLRSLSQLGNLGAGPCQNPAKRGLKRIDCSLTPSRGCDNTLLSYRT